MPSIPDLIKRTHTRSDGKYVDKYAEKIVQEVYSLATQMSAPEGTDLESDEVATPTSERLNTIFHQVTISILFFVGLFYFYLHGFRPVKRKCFIFGHTNSFLL